MEEREAEIRPLELRRCVERQLEEISLAAQTVTLARPCPARPARSLLGRGLTDLGDDQTVVEGLVVEAGQLDETTVDNMRNLEANKGLKFS